MATRGSIWSGLEAARHIDRDRALMQLEKTLKSTEDIETCPLIDEAAAHARRLISSDAWEARQGGFSAAKVLLFNIEDEEFKQDILRLALEHLGDSNTHVRLAVAECFSALAQNGGDEVFLAARDPIMQSIEENFERDATSGDASPEDDVMGDVPSPSANPRANPAQSGVRSMYRPHSWARKAELVASMGSWQHLETSFKALQRLLEGRAAAPASTSNPKTPLVTPDIRLAIKRALTHRNRFIRETAFYTLRALFGGFLGEGFEDGVEVAELLATGLGDNWSQVRYESPTRGDRLWVTSGGEGHEMPDSDGNSVPCPVCGPFQCLSFFRGISASVATRAFISAQGSSAEQFYHILLPPMCLNRHYIAEGVRIFSQETWKLAMGTRGREELAKVAPETVNYYVEQCSSSDYAVREAACHCLGELAAKVDPVAVAPGVGQMLGALVGAMGDLKWPVREAACAAAGQCVLTFPEESRSLRDPLLSTSLRLLRDRIPSVRESAAIAAGRFAEAYRDEVLPQVLSELRMLLPQAKQQQSDSVRNGAGPSGSLGQESPASPMDKSSDTATPSTSSLDGEAECPQEARTGEPWEASEAAIYLLRELSATCPGKVPEFLPTLAELGHCTGFEHFPDLLDTLWKQLPTIAKNMGKKTFKAYLELFLDPLFWALTCRQRLAESAAGYCISELQELIGRTIFRARLDDHQRAALDSSPFVGPPALLAQSAAINRTIIKSASPVSPGLKFGAPIIMPPRTRPE